jgi:hypothetical protein
MVLGSLKTFIVEKVIKAGIFWLIAFLNPAAAFIKAVKAIIDIVQFLIERGSEIMGFVSSILDSLGSIAKGALGIVAEKVEGSLAKALPLVISFLASLLGLGGISEKIHEVIEKVRAPIGKAIDFVVMGAVKGFKKLFGGAVGWAKGKAQQGKDWAKGKAQGIKDRFTGTGAKTAGAAEQDVQTGFAMSGKPHTLTAHRTGGRVRVVMASDNPGDLIAKAEKARDDATKAGKPDVAAAFSTFLAAAEERMAELRTIEANPSKSEEDKKAAFGDTLRWIAGTLAELGARYGIPDLDFANLDVPSVELHRLVYRALIRAREDLTGRRAAAPPVTADNTDATARFDRVLQDAESAYQGARGSQPGAGGDPASFTGNQFSFAGATYFVDQDAGYIFPLTRVGASRGIYNGKMVACGVRNPADQKQLEADPERKKLFAAFAYTTHSTDLAKFRKDAFSVAWGNPMAPNQGAMFLAAFVAEPTRNPNAHMTNMLLLDKNDSDPFFRSAPMTAGGTSAAEKERDPSLASVPGNQSQPPTPVTDAEVKMVSDRFVADMGPNVDLAAEFKKSPAALEDLIFEYLKGKSELVPK